MIAEAILRRLVAFPGVRSLWRACPVGSVDLRVRCGIFSRPHYAYGVYSAARLAKKLELNSISVVEFGVAGGNGLLALERIAATVQDYLNIDIHVVGFDSGQGMPPPVDYRDLPYVWSEGFYRMNETKLRARLSTSTQLVLGDVGETVPLWLQGAVGRGLAGPVGFVAFDLDYYSSTKKALRLFETEKSDHHLPRVYCYFDDIIWPEYACYNKRTGELRAIEEFNQEHAHKTICPINLFRYTRLHPAAWNEQIYVMHDFNHPLYVKNITGSDEQQRQLPL